MSTKSYGAISCPDASKADVFKTEECEPTDSSVSDDDLYMSYEIAAKVRCFAP